MYRKICAAALAVIMTVGIMCRGVVSAADCESVDKSQYDKYCISLSRYTPGYYEIDLQSSDKNIYLDSYNSFSYYHPTSDDMIYMIRGAYDILVEELSDNPFESYDVADWSYNCWFEDLNFDGIPEFIIGGIIDTNDNKHIRYYNVLVLFQHDIWIESQVNENHGAGHDGFGYKLYKDSQTGNYSYLTVDTYNQGNILVKTVRQLDIMLNEYNEYDICSEQTDTSTNKTTYTIEGRNVSSSEYRQFTDDLNSRYTEVKVNTKTMDIGEIFEGSVLEEAYDAYSIDESVEGNHFNYAGNNFDDTSSSSDAESSYATLNSQNQNSSSAQNSVNSKSLGNPFTGIALSFPAALTVTISAAVLLRKNKPKR